jgi:hypothetical protein
MVASESIGSAISYKVSALSITHVKIRPLISAVSAGPRVFDAGNGIGVRVEQFGSSREDMGSGF